MAIAALWCALGVALFLLALPTLRQKERHVRHRIALEPRRSIYVVDVAGKHLVVGSSEAGLQLLGELDAEAIARLPAPEAVPPLLRWRRA